MWTYRQLTGALDRDGVIAGSGYSGAAPLGRNNPQMQNVREVGPIPQGRYIIGRPFDSDDHGPFCLPLVADPENEMFERSGFLMHGDSKEHPGCASKGCIIMPRDVREKVSYGGDSLLTVVPV